MIHNVQVDTVVGLAVATVGSVYLIKTTVMPTLCVTTLTVFLPGLQRSCQSSCAKQLWFQISGCLSTSDCLSSEE